MYGWAFPVLISSAGREALPMLLAVNKESELWVKLEAPLVWV